MSEIQKRDIREPSEGLIRLRQTVRSGCERKHSPLHCRSDPRDITGNYTLITHFGMVFVSLCAVLSMFPSLPCVFV